MEKRRAHQQQLTGEVVGNRSTERWPLAAAPVGSSSSRHQHPALSQLSTNHSTEQIRHEAEQRCILAAEKKHLKMVGGESDLGRAWGSSERTCDKEELELPQLHTAT
jgi:hypothetical protein